MKRRLSNLQEGLNKGVGNKARKEAYGMKAEDYADERGLVDLIGLSTDDGFLLTVDFADRAKRAGGYHRFFGIAWGEYEDVEGGLHVLRFEGVPLEVARDAVEHDLLLGYEAGELHDTAKSVVEVEVIWDR